MGGGTKTFVHHDGALGDVILSLPCLRIIAGSSSVHFVGRADVGRLLGATGIVEEASTSGSARYGPLYSGHAGEEAERILSAFSRAVVFTAHPKAPMAENIRRIVLDTRIVETIPSAGQIVHVAEFRLRQLAPDALFPEGPLLSIACPSGEVADSMPALAGYDDSRPLIAIHPGSGAASKCWPLERYLELCEALQEGVRAVMMILTGPAEPERVSAQVEDFSRGREGVLHVAGAELAVVAARLGRCSLYVGNDSGISHLAAAAGCRVLALFGPTDPRLWRPAGPRVEVLAAADLRDIDVGRVYTRAAAMLRRSPHPSPLPQGKREKAKTL